MRALSRVSINNVIKSYRKFNKIGIPLKEIVKLYEWKYISRNRSILFGKEIIITDSFWHLHSLNELFVDEVYAFKSNKKEPLIVDCGSNIGLSIIFFKKLFPDAYLMGFEPDNEIFDALKKNLSIFNFSNVDIFQKAVWIDETPLLFKKSGSLGGHLTKQTDENTIEIQTVRLRSIIENKKIDFLKIDVEGAEYEIINDCRDVLINVDNIFVEYHSFHNEPQMLGELIIFLKDAGFKVYIKEAWENMKKPYLEKKGPFFDLQLNIFGYRR